MTINTNFGIYNKEIPISEKPISDLCMDFVFPMEIISHSQWKRCGMVANFLANYQSLNFPNRKKAMLCLSTIINELLENAVKFSSDNNKLVHLSLRHNKNKIAIEAINMADELQAINLNNFITKLQKGDVEQLFFDQIEYTAESATEKSGVGLLTLIKDYQAKLGIKIFPKTEENSKEYDISVLVYVPIEHIKNL